MSFYDLYHKFFGGRKGDDNRFSDSTEERENYNSARDSQWNFGGNDMRDTFFNIKISPDPFEMHLFFEKVDDTLKSLLTPDLFSGFDVPAIEENINPRDLYLKPEFNKTKPENKNMQKEVGKGTEDSAWLERLFPSRNQQESSFKPRVFSSFRSVIRKSVTLPDGTVKTEEIIQNSDGTEQRTESQTSPIGSSQPQFDFSFINPDFSEFFNHMKVPQLNETSKNDVLKPGFEELVPKGEKIDKDLDEIISSDIKNVPTFSKSHDVPQLKQGSVVQRFTRRTVTLPNGVVQSEEIVHNPDGTEQRTVTQTLPDQTPLEPLGINTDKTSSNMGLSFTLKGVKDLIDMFFK